MTKSDLIDLIADRARVSKASAERAINTFVDAIRETVSKGERFTITGFGTFLLSRRAARKGRNPKTGEPIDIPAIEKIKFKASGRLREHGGEGGGGEGVSSEAG